MRFFIYTLLSVLMLGTQQGNAAYRQMNFKLRTFAENQYEYSSVWNENTQEAIVRFGLQLESADSQIAEKPLSFSSFKNVHFSVLDVPELVENCGVVSQLNFEYTPGLPNYLLQMTLKGAGCKLAVDYLDVLQNRLIFYGIVVPQSEPADIIININR
jgi:hypothetical protein